MKFKNSIETNTTHLKYRPDIDGLRALAVLAVVAFHAFPEKIKGGFIGVDIFFVISGYLITSIIFQDLSTNRFSFLDFYGRRIRRIFPSLITVLIFTYAFGWFTLLQDEFQQLGKHIAAGSIFISNFILWNEIGYFDNTAETKVLLHLWSLGIEEQFYLFWPLLAFLAWRRKLNLFTISITICIFSFALNIEASDKDRILDFFSPQTRFWELFIGSILAWIFVFQPKSIHRFESTLNNCLNHVIFSNPSERNQVTLAHIYSTLGIALITTTFLIINKKDIFPGWWALLPTIGTFLLISAGNQGWFNRYFLSNPILIWIGLISFPLYLWHWPLLSFGRIVFSEPPPPLVRGGLIILSFIFAWLTYQFIEKPIRFGAYRKFKTILVVTLLVCIGYIGFNTDLRNGLPFRTAVVTHKANSDLLLWDTFKSPKCTKDLGTEANFCITFGNESNIRVAIIGDSTGNSLAPGLAEILDQKGIGLINIGGWTCPPIKGLVETTHWGRLNKCPEIINKTYQYLAKHKNIDTVIFATFAADLKYLDIPGVPFDAPLEQKFIALKPFITQSIQELLALGKKVIITYDAPYSEVAARDCIPRPIFNRSPSKCDISVNELPDRQPNVSFYDDFFKDNKKVCVFNQSDLMLKNDRLNFLTPDGLILLRDTHHLSHLGSRKMAEILIESPCFQFRN